MAGTYVQLTREEFEDWLNDIGFRGKWEIKRGRGGVYWLHLSDTVAIEINSTTGRRDDVMERGRASMKCKLVSRVTGYTLNKRAIKQSHFKRTVNWRTTWNDKGIKPLKAVYVKSKDWYDTLGGIEDRDAYKADMLALIEAKPNWQNDSFLSSLHAKVEKGGILTNKQVAAIQRTTAPGAERTRPSTPETAPSSGGDVSQLARIEAIPGWDEHEFLQSLHSWVERGRDLTEKQLAALERFEENAKRRSRPAPEPSGPSADDLLTDLRRLWQVADGADKAWVAEFGKRVKRDRSWSRQDGQQVDRLLRKYRRRMASTDRLVDRFLSR